MEQFFEILPKSPHYDEVITYEQACVRERDDVKAFMQKYHIDGKAYMIYNGYLWVENTAVNKDRFSDQFLPNVGLECAAFKKSSQIGKAFKRSGIVKAQKPPVISFFSYYGKDAVHTKLFSFNGKRYCSINAKDIVRCPKYFRRLTESEAYTVLMKMSD